MQVFFSPTPFKWLGIGDSITFGDPVATSLQTSLQEWTPLRNATGISHLLPLLGRRFVTCSRPTKLLREYASGARTKSIILHGSYGTGKSAVARMILKARSGDKFFLSQMINGANFKGSKFLASTLKSTGHQISHHRLTATPWGRSG